MKISDFFERLYDICRAIFDYRFYIICCCIFASTTWYSNWKSNQSISKDPLSPAMVMFIDMDQSQNAVKFNLNGHSVSFIPNKVILPILDKYARSEQENCQNEVFNIYYNYLYNLISNAQEIILLDYQKNDDILYGDLLIDRKRLSSLLEKKLFFYSKKTNQDIDVDWCTIFNQCRAYHYYL
ncbi:hypothetical protein N9A04_00530 [Rickettsiales bacterium]|nr:hypothetical protein [Rickettsiales bacterium]